MSDDRLNTCPDCKELNCNCQCSPKPRVHPFFAGILKEHLESKGRLNKKDPAAYDISPTGRIVRNEPEIQNLPMPPALNHIVQARSAQIVADNMARLSESMANSDLSQMIGNVTSNQTLALEAIATAIVNLHDIAQELHDDGCTEDAKRIWDETASLQASLDLIRKSK